MPGPPFEKAELERYSRHLLLPGFGRKGQEKLKGSSVILIGAGALGAPATLYIAAAGVGRIRIVDPDHVADHNLQRQVLFRTEDIGKEKAQAAKAAIDALNPWIEVEAITDAISSDNAMKLLEGMDLLIDGSDNFPTRYLANDASVLAGIPNVHASVFQFEGQIAVFNAGGEKERAVDYRDLFPEPPPPGSIPGCNEGGVLGMLPGIMGSLQANEAIKLLSGIGAPLDGELLIFDALRAESRRVRIPRDPQHPGIEKLIDYQSFCGVPSSRAKGGDQVPSIEPEELQGKMKKGENFTLIDVRERGEKEIVDIGGANIPLRTLKEKQEFPEETDGPIILYCRTGARSSKAARILQEKMPERAVYNLRGGILKWIEAVDPSLPAY